MLILSFSLVVILFLGFTDSKIGKNPGIYFIRGLDSVLDLPLDGVSPDDGTFGADGVAQAGHELHIPLAEPGVCGLSVDEQLEASGAVRVALQADSVFATSKRREYSRAWSSPET